MLRIKDESGNILSGLYRNDVGAIIADESEEYHRYLFEKQRLEQINNLSDDVNSLKSEMKDIKNMLLAILDKANTK